MIDSDNDAQLTIVLAGHVDHGKSTIVGRLLVETGSVPKGKIEKVRSYCLQNSKTFEYAFLLDALKEERSQGITMDCARLALNSGKRKYSLIDAPGHVELVKNMVTGASQADASLLVIDAAEGIQENSKRHAYFLSMLGLKSVLVLVNKMDLVGYDQRVFLQLVEQFKQFLTTIQFQAKEFIPVSGASGANLRVRSTEMPWYDGPTVLESIDQLQARQGISDLPFRMPVQGLYKFTSNQDSRRIVAGLVEEGSLRVGDEVVFYPSRKSARVRSFDAFSAEQPQFVNVGQSVGFTLDPQIVVTRGEVACRKDEPAPCVSSAFKASIFWIGRAPLEKGKDYTFKIGTTRVTGRISKLVQVMDSSRLEVYRDRSHVARHEVADCVLQMDREIAFDLVAKSAGIGRFVIVDQFEIAGGGIVRDVATPDEDWIARKVAIRDQKWIVGEITPASRSKRYRQRPAAVLIMSPNSEERKKQAKLVEARLFREGAFVYYLGVGNLLYGVDADIKGSTQTEFAQPEHIRRLAEVSHILLDAGLVAVISTAPMSQEELRLFELVVGSGKTEVIWIGEKIISDISISLHLSEPESAEERAEKVRAWLFQQGILSGASQ